MLHQTYEISDCSGFPPKIKKMLTFVYNSNTSDNGKHDDNDMTNWYNTGEPSAVLIIVYKFCTVHALIPAF